MAADGSHRSEAASPGRPRLAGLHGRRRHGAAPAIAQVSADEGRLERCAAGAGSIVEIGIAEGGSAWHLRRALSPDGTITLIDTYPTVLRMNMSRVIARRLVESVDRGHVEWLRMRSDAAVHGWSRPIDFLFIDGDHAYEAVSATSSSGVRT